MFNFSIGEKVNIELITGEIVVGIVIEVLDDYGIKIKDYGYVWKDDVKDKTPVIG